MYVEGLQAFPVPLIDGLNKKFTKKVVLVLSVEPDWVAKTANLDQAVKDKLLTINANPPTEKDLGLALYPEAELTFDTLIQNPGMTGYLYPYASRDPASKIIAFYEKATGKKAQGVTKDNVGILIKGDSMENAELAVSVQDLSAMMASAQGLGANVSIPQTLIFVAKDLNKRKLSDADAARLEALKKNPPAEKDLGAPLYPGAQLDIDALRAIMLGGSSPNRVEYPYSAAASFDKVVDFYRTKTGTTPKPWPATNQTVFLLSAAGSQSATEVVVLNKGDPKTTSISFVVHTASGQGAGSLTSLPSLSASDQAAIKFLDLVKNGTAKEIQAAIKGGAEVNPKQPFMGITPLKQAAAFNPNGDVITTLLKAGADAKAQGGMGDSILAEAANHVTDTDILKALIKAGASSDGVNPDLQHALNAAANLNPSAAVVEALLAAGADPKTADKWGVTRPGQSNPTRSFPPRPCTGRSPTRRERLCSISQRMPPRISSSLPSGAARMSR